MTQRAAFDQLLPLPPSDDAVARHDWDYIYEPDAQAVLEHVLTRYIESLVYQAVMENVASEHAARMVAMKAASDNANKLIDTLNLVYNKARQAAIRSEEHTSELQSLMRISYAVFCLKKQTSHNYTQHENTKKYIHKNKINKLKVRIEHC